MRNYSDFGSTATEQLNHYVLVFTFLFLFFGHAGNSAQSCAPGRYGLYHWAIPWALNFGVLPFWPGMLIFFGFPGLFMVHRNEYCELLDNYWYISLNHSSQTSNWSKSWGYQSHCHGVLKPGNATSRWERKPPYWWDKYTPSCLDRWD